MDSDVNYSELFGVSLSNENGGVSDASGEAELDGNVSPGNENEDAGSDVSPDNENGDAGSDSSADNSSGEGADGTNGTRRPARPAQSEKERRGFAAARRRAEMEAEKKIEAARLEERESSGKLIEQILQTGKITDPASGRKITTREEFEASSAAIEKNRRDAILKRAGIGEDELVSIARETPELKEELRRGKEAEEAVRRQADGDARADIEKQLAEIRKYDGSVKSLADVARLPEFDEIYARVKRGYRIDDAYFLVNREKLIGAERDRAEAAGRQRALNSRASKEHLSAAEARSKGGVSVPADVMEQYRIFNPDASVAEIENHYRRMKGSSPGGSPRTP